jgi:hypothetical protein
MKNTIMLLTALALAFCCAVPVFAQYDSSQLDVGYLHLKRDFTQTITIKGADLKKMPFTNLSEAIAAWFYGGYTQPVTLQYVVDGNPVSDVNAYSIYDIEEVVLVQNAGALVNTADGQQEMVIVRTRHGQGESGMTADAQIGLVNFKQLGQTSPLRGYHNYYFTRWRNLDKVSFGISGNYQRDVFPFPGDIVKTPYNLSRWRLNGYLTWRPDSHNRVEMMLNYTPEQMASELGNLSSETIQPGAGTGYSTDVHSTQHFVLPRLLWHSDLSSKWTNDLQATYVHSTGNTYDFFNSVTDLQSDSLLVQYSGGSNATRSYHLWVRDHLGYTATAGHWSIEPAVNVTYEHFNEQNSVVDVGIVSTYPTTGILNTATVPEESTASSGLKENMVVLTPVLDISYRRALDVQGGVLVDAQKQNANNRRDAFPFASLSLDFLKMADDNAAAGLKVFGSYAQRAVPSPQGYALTDLSSTGAAASNSPTISYSTYELYGTTNYIAPSYPPSRVYWVWETGASYTGWKNRLTIQYTYERRNFLKTLVIFPANSNGTSEFPEWVSTLQHLDIRVKVLDAEGVRWLTGVNATLLQNNSHFMYVDYPNNYAKQDIGDDSPSPGSWTGGWVNRVQVNRFTAGFDLLYHFGESVLGGSYIVSPDTAKVNSVITPNIYVGYSWHLPGEGVLELFVESRGLIQNSTNDLLDDRRYYTVGGKLSL